MNLGEIESLTRREIDDEVGNDASRYVKQVQIYAYANEAENEACRRARLLVDSSTAAICQIAVVACTAVYAFDERIIFIKRGKLAGGTAALGKASHVIMDERCPGWEAKSGVVEAFVTGLHSNQLQLYKIPNSDDTLKLTVIRTPLVAMTSPAAIPEIPSRLHLPLILWIKHKIFNNQDKELFDKTRADKSLADFEKYFGRRCAVDDLFDEMQELRTGADDTSDGYY